MFRNRSFSPSFLAGAGKLLAHYYRVVRWTNRLRRVPENSFFAPFDSGPVIIAMWHGEHFLLPFFVRRTDPVSVMVTLHRDGEIIANYGQSLGLKIVRGSGDHGKEFKRKRAVQAFIGLLRLLERGEHVAMTADVPKVARVAGLGIVTLAKHSGCPIIAMGCGASRKFRLKNWDRSSIALPFGRLMMVRSEPIRVPRDADDAALEQARRTVEEQMKEVTARAYALAEEGPPSLRRRARSHPDRAAGADGR